MAKIKKDNSANPWAIDEGVYVAVVKAVEEQKSKKGSGTYLRWSFQIKDPLRDDEVIDDDIVLSGNSPSLLQDDSKLDKWLKACGVDCEDEDTVDTSDAEGAVVKVLVENNESGEKTYSNVIKIRPASKKKSESKEEKDESKDKDDEEDAKKKAAEKKKKEAEKKKAEKKAEKEAKSEEKEDKPKSKSDEDDEELWDFK